MNSLVCSYCSCCSSIARRLGPQLSLSFCCGCDESEDDYSEDNPGLIVTPNYSAHIIMGATGGGDNDNFSFPGGTFALCLTNSLHL